ncbi:MAG TPA: secondary thiamine-phosphate synthase enzyme [Clostridiales bacterium]|nr:secondary thiamine-phosphate synthase enzyme [Clostridiales bacterium]
MFIKLDLRTNERQELMVITDLVKSVISEKKLENGLCFLFCPHTTAGLTINSYLDPATAKDLINEVDRLVPTRTDFVHVFDTPSDAAGHIKSSLVGGQLGLILENGEFMLGSSQGIFFWEFDGPRNRQIYLKFIS